MSLVSVPDTSDKRNGWLEIKNFKRELIDKDIVIGISRFYLYFNSKYLDKKRKPRKEKCWVISFFNSEKSALMWTNFQEIGDKIVEVEYSAILLDQKNNIWAVSKPFKDWSGEIDYDENEKIVGIKISVETETGIKSAYFQNLNPPAGGEK